jgi:hypothetical protein
MKRIFFIAAIVLTLLFLFLLYILISNIRRAPEETVREVPFPTKSQIVPTGVPPLIIEEEPLIEQIIARLPVSEPEYDIEYLSSSNTFVITIKESPFEQNSEKARQWFLQNGFSNTDGLNIIYNSYEWVE